MCSHEAAHLINQLNPSLLILSVCFCVIRVYHEIFHNTINDDFLVRHVRTAINASNDIAGFTSNRRLAGVDINNTTGGYQGIPVSPASPPSPPSPNIPEPGTFGLVILGMAVVAAGVRRWRTGS